MIPPKSTFISSMATLADIFINKQKTVFAGISLKSNFTEKLNPT